MWCSKVLVAYDGSTPARKALDLAFAIARETPAVEIVLVHIVKLYSSGAAAVGIDAIYAEDAEDLLDEMENAAARMPNHLSTRLLKGTSPADLILKCAREEDCDLIIMGSRGRGGVKGYLGSVSHAVVQASPIAVLIAKDADTEAMA